ncbi:MAG: hypothetical protein HZA53_14165 [Planctomycetes bacterium]|nr:hypothetical protein [Planctomycetota bacterium]
MHSLVHTRVAASIAALSILFGLGSCGGGSSTIPKPPPAAAAHRELPLLLPGEFAPFARLELDQSAPGESLRLRIVSTIDEPACFAFELEVAIDGASTTNATSVDHLAARGVLDVGSIWNGAGDLDAARLTLVHVDASHRCIEGMLDPSFSGDGVATHGGAGIAPNEHQQGYVIQTDAQDRVYVAGITSGTSPGGHLVVWRFRADGSLDLSFAGTGYVHRPLLAQFEGPLSLSVDEQGFYLLSAILTSTQPTARPYLELRRYTLAGFPDVSFGNFGSLVIQPPPGGSYGSAQLARDRLGRLILAATRLVEVGQVFLVDVHRYLPGGQRDFAFRSGQPIAIGNPMGGSALATSIALDSQDRIVIGGMVPDTSGDPLSTPVLWRLDAQGLLDPSFDGDGFRIEVGLRDTVLGLPSIARVAIDSQDRIVVASSLLLTRLLASGSTDFTFGLNGYSRPETGPFGGGFALDASGRPLIVNSFPVSLPPRPEFQSSLALQRLDANGRTDPFFGQDGVFRHDGAAGGIGLDLGTAVCVDHAGRIVIAGASRNASGDLDLAVWRVR